MNRLNLFVYTILLLIFSLLLSCQNEKEAGSEQLLRQAEEMLEEHPDSALLLLQSIDASGVLDKSGKIYYNFLLIQAKDRNLINISGDSVMLKEAVDYYSHHNDAGKAARAYYYQGRVYRLNNRPQAAIASNLNAVEHARLADDPQMLAYIHHEIGKLYQQEGNFNEALKNYRLSREYFLRAGNSRNACLAHKFIGTAYLYASPMQTDSAIISYHRALDCAMNLKDSFEIAVLHKNISLAYGEKGDWANEKTYMLRALHYSNDNDILAVVQRMLAEIYANADQADSAAYYMNELMANPVAHNHIDDRYYNHIMLYRMYKKFGNPSLALVHHEISGMLSDSIQRYKTDQSVLEIQKKYDKQVLENRYNQVVMQRLYLVITVIACLLLGILAVWFFVNRIRRKKTQLMEAEQALQTFRLMLAKKDEKLQALDRALTGYDEKSEKLTAFLVDKLDIARKIAQMSALSADNNETFIQQYDKLFGRNLLEAISWDNIYPVINDLYGGFVDKVKSAYLGLAEKDLQMCCLVRAGFKTEEMAVLLDYTHNTVRVKRSRLAQKMGFNDYESFLKHIMEL